MAIIFGIQLMQRHLLAYISLRLASYCQTQRVMG